METNRTMMALLRWGPPILALVVVVFSCGFVIFMVFGQPLLPAGSEKGSSADRSVQQEAPILPPQVENDRVSGGASSGNRPIDDGQETTLFGPLTMITRSGWGARPLDPGASGETAPFDPQTNPGGLLVYPEPLSDWLRTIVVHHTALPLSDGPREIQALHMDERGYADVAYHFMIDPEGFLYEGRPLNLRGAHVAGYNTGSIGVVLIGNFEVLEPTSAQLDTLNILVAHLAETFPVTHLAGHKDFNPQETQCPGAHLSPILPEIAARQNLLYGTGGYVAPAWPTQ